MRRPLLLPLVPLYAAGLALREMRLERGWEKVRRLRWPVISVGNLSAGGAGKTPLVIALARLLTAGGFHVDVLSRGYGRTSRQAARVRVDGTAEEFGDEPLLIAREAGVPVYVAAERFEAGHLAEAESGAHQAHASSGAKAQAPFGDFSARLKSCPDTSGSAQESCPVTEPLDTALNLHILDDGFQHRQLARDVDVLLVNREDWHDQMLPAGNLREGLAAVRRASVLVIPAEDASFESELRAWGWRGPVWRVRRRMEVPQVEGRVVAFCGIARPEQFFAGLETAGIQIAAKKKFADHHRYSINDLKELVAMARAAGATALITTEKDRMRIGSLAAGIADSLPMLTVSLTTVIGDEDHACEWLTRTLASSPSCARL